MASCTLPARAVRTPFAVATVNVGASAQITATATTGAATLPLAISLCQTNPMSGVCISSIGSTVTTTINATATPTFAIFATASGSVPFVPQTNRIFVEFTDANEIVRLDQRRGRNAMMALRQIFRRLREF
jgi:hypothetical protein